MRRRKSASSPSIRSTSPTTTSARRWRRDRRRASSHARRHVPRAPRDGVVRPLPRRDGLSREQDPRPERPRWSNSPYERARSGAGLVAWYYEQRRHAADAHRPQPGRHAGRQDPARAERLVRNRTPPVRPRARRIDPESDDRRPADRSPSAPLSGVSVSYVGVVGTGGLSLALPNHWIVASRIRSMPDTVDEFVGYRIGLDLIAWDVPGLEGIKTFHPNGKATVRNVTLPAEYSHVWSRSPRTSPILRRCAPGSTYSTPRPPERGAAPGRRQRQPDLRRRRLVLRQAPLGAGSAALRPGQARHAARLSCPQTPEGGKCPPIGIIPALRPPLPARPAGMSLERRPGPWPESH